MVVTVLLFLALVCFACAAGGLGTFGGFVQTVPLGLALATFAWLWPMLFK